MATENVLYYGDNLDILRRYIKDESVDLVYLDPPFNSNQEYNVLFQEQNGSRAAAQVKAFEDTWQWDQNSAAAFHDVVLAGGRVADVMVAFEKFLGHNDVLAYLSMMTPRLVELRRVLKSTGSIYLHCDPTASHYLKLVMDAVFGQENFLSEVIWKRTSSHNRAKRWGPVHDTLLFYSKTDSVVWNRIVQDYDEKYVEQFYCFGDDRGRFQIDNLTGPGVRTGDSGESWRQADPTKRQRHWEPPPDRALPEWFVFPDGYAKMSVRDRLDVLDAQGLIQWPRKQGGMPRFKRYLLSGAGAPIQDVITDIPPMQIQAQERLGYPTQKPEALLERIILASSNEGDVVLDPFCGCGTAVAVAQRRNRRWIGIDITHLAITLIKHRLQTSFGESASYVVIGEPVSLPDAEDLAKQDPYQFQWWALGLVGARPVDQKKGAEKGIDGRFYFFPDQKMKGKPEQIIFSVKAGNVTVSHVRDLRGVVDREKAAIGVLISINPSTAPMRTEAASAGFYESKELGSKKYPRLQLLTIEDLLNGRGVDCPPFAQRQGNVTLKKAPRVEPKRENEGVVQTKLGTDQE